MLEAFRRGRRKVRARHPRSPIQRPSLAAFGRPSRKRSIHSRPNRGIVIRLLRHDRQRKIIAIATFVIGQEGVAADGDGRTIGQVAKGADGFYARGVIKDRENGSNWNDARAHIVEQNRRPANTCSKASHLICCRSSAIERYLVSRVGFEDVFFES